MNPEDCVIYVARRVGEAKQARDRAHWVGGRIFNWMAGCDPDHVVISGAVLANAFRWLGEGVPDDFPREAEMELSLDVALQLDQDLRTKAAAEGMLR